jgi:hypothetical protein
MEPLTQEVRPMQNRDFIRVQASGRYKRWLERLARANWISEDKAIGWGLAMYAEATGFPVEYDPAPERISEDPDTMRRLLGG